MRKLPPAPVVRSLREKLVGAIASHGTKEKALLDFFFRRAMRGSISPIKVKDILDECPDGPDSEQGIYNAIGRIKDIFQTHFDKNPFEPIRVELETSSHVLRFSRNRPPCPHVFRFWEPYFHSLDSTVLYYPEPQFFRHRNGTYIRHSDANWREDTSRILELFDIDKSDLTPSYSFVPSGLAAAMASIFACFHANDTELYAKPLTAVSAGLPEGSANAIVLGTPTTSLDLISSLERDWSMRTGRENDHSIFSVFDPKTGVDTSHEDEIQEERDFTKKRQQLTKWAIVTRRIEPIASHEGTPPGRVVTLLAGHSRSVQGVTDFLTSEETIKPLSAKFSRRLPKMFQICFRVEMHKFYGELEKATASVEAALKMDERTHHQKVS